MMMCRWSLTFALLAPLALALLGCGGAGQDSDRPERPAVAGSEPVDECALDQQRRDDGWEFSSVVDFERPDGNMAAKWQASCNDVSCGFYFNYDTALSPSPGSACSEESGLEASVEQPLGTPFAFPLDEPRCNGSEASYHLVAQNIAVCTGDKTGRQGWGATLAITFNAAKTDSGRADPPLDASDWDGVALWARRGEGASGQAILVSARDLYSSGQGEHCSVDAGSADALKCDPFGLAVLLEPEWRFITVPFSLMRQKGFGVPSPLGQLDATGVVGLEIGFSAGNWDVWLDDVALYREPR